MREGSFAPGNPGTSTTGGRSASAENATNAGSFSTGDSQTFKRAIDMTDDELAAIASGATLHVVK